MWKRSILSVVVLAAALLATQMEARADTLAHSSPSSVKMYVSWSNVSPTGWEPSVYHNGTTSGISTHHHPTWTMIHPTIVGGAEPGVWGYLYRDLVFANPDLLYAIGVPRLDERFGSVVVDNKSTIQKFDSSGTPLGTFASDIVNPKGIAVNNKGHVFVTQSNLPSPGLSPSPGWIQEYDAAGVLLDSFGGSAQGFGVAVDASDNIYATARDSFGDDALLKYNTSNTLIDTITAPGMDHPGAVTFDSAGNYYVAQRGTVQEFRFGPLGGLPLGSDDLGAVYMFDSSDNFVTMFSSEELWDPIDLAVDPETGLLWVADAKNDKFFAFDPSAPSSVPFIFGSSHLTPVGLAFRPSETETAVTPEPTTLALSGLGMALLALRERRRNKKRKTQP